MSAEMIGLLDWSLDRDDQGGREYKALFLVKVSDPLDGPLTALLASGLPAVGSSWGINNEVDPWVYCQPKASVKQWHGRPGERHIWWAVEQTFSSPTRRGTRCNNTNVDDPMSEPPKVSGSFVRYTKEAQYRADGSLILSSCLQPITGIEKDDGRAVVTIERNSLDNNLGQYASFFNTLNDSTVWGVPARHIKFSEFSFEQKFYGSCYVYYTHRLGFEIRGNGDGFDLDDVPDMGVMEFIFSEGGPYDNDIERAKPESYRCIKDPNGENIVNPVALDGNGRRLQNPQVAGNTVFIPTVTLYNESNFYLMGIPSFL